MALVPAFLGLRRDGGLRSRAPFRVARDPDLVSTDVRPPRPAPEPAPVSLPQDAADAACALQPPAPCPPDAADTAPSAIDKPRRWSGLGRHPELIAAHRKLSDHVGLWRICRARVCRRARACAGPKAVACLYDHREIVQPLLSELGRIMGNMHPEE